MKKIYILLLCGLILIPVKGIGQLYNDGLLFVSPNSLIYSGGDFIQQNQLYLEGDFVVGADYISQSGQFTSAISGRVTFLGATTQTIKGTGGKVTFYDLNIENPSNVLVSNDFELAVNHALNLNRGDLVLQKGAQLVQDFNGHSLNTGSGNLYMFSQVNGNLYRYHVWTSPVTSSINTYTIAGVLRDGSASDWINNHPPLQFTNNFDGSNVTSPVTVSSYWLYTYFNDTQGWQHAGYQGNIMSGYGFTMKGTSFTDAWQNYVFVGKPNNGDYNLPLAPGSWTLVGNPYPSALDANQFLDDNQVNLTVGTGLYFWDHFGGNSHMTSGYQGGYAVYTKSGGTPATAHPDVNQEVLSGIKIPQRYIPVGQGFLVKGTPAGANLLFTNNQRIFKSHGAESVFMQTEKLQTNESAKIRLGHKDEAGYHRQILLAFFDHTTEGVDAGYDGRMLDVNPNDMYWMIENKEYVIQARPYQTEVDFNIGITSAKQEVHTIMIDALEGYTGHVILKDTQTGLNYDLTEQSANILIEQGTFNSRFSVQVTPFTLNMSEKEKGTLKLIYLKNQGLIVYNPEKERVISVQIFNLLGQELTRKKIGTTDNQIHVRHHLNSGIYIVKTITDTQNKIQKIQIN